VVPPPRLTVPSKKIYSLSFTASSDLSGGEVLQGAVLSGIRYVFTSLAGSAGTFNIPGVSKVCFWLDRVFIACAYRSNAETATIFPPGTEAAFLFRGAKSASWDTTKISPGTHQIVQKVTTGGGITETDTASFTVSNRAKDFLGDLERHGTELMTLSSDPVVFNVYRMNGACGGTWSPTRIASGLPETQPSYTDTTVAAGQTYCYAVTEVDKITAQESLYSPKVTAVIPP
jgi:hypothetical protein